VPINVDGSTEVCNDEEFSADSVATTDHDCLTESSTIGMAMESNIPTIALMMLIFPQKIYITILFVQLKEYLNRMSQTEFSERSVLPTRNPKVCE